MSYRNTLQSDALKLVAKKMQSSLAVEIEPETIAVNGNGNGNGHRDDLFGIGPTVELVPANDHVNGNGPGGGHSAGPAYRTNQV